MYCLHASPPYIRDLQTCTTAAAYSGFVLEQQSSIKSPAFSTTNFSMFVHLNDRRPRADIIRAGQLEWRENCSLKTTHVNTLKLGL